MSNIFLKIGAVLVVLLAAMFSVPYFVDWTSYRATLEERISEFVGREVRVGGAVNLRLLPVPYLSFENVRVADADGRFGEPMLRAESFKAWLAVGPLLTGTLEASSIELLKPEFRVRLEEDASPTSRQPAEKTPPKAIEPRISLKSIRITDGSLLLVRGNGREVTRLEKIAGEVNAAEADGPFGFRGSFRMRQTDHDLTLSTGKLETGSGLRLKAVGRLVGSVFSYAFDGRLENMRRLPRLEGDLTVKSTGTQNATRSGPLPVPAFEAKSKLKASPDGARLEEIAALSEQGTRPQTVNGDIALDWRESSSAEMRFAARWLDFDGQLRADGEETLAQAMLRAAEALRAVLPETARSRLAVNVEQAKLGGEDVSDIALIAERRGKDIEIVQAGLSVPGTGRIETKGTLAGTALTQDYKGEVRLRAQSLNALSAWILKRKPAEAKSDTTVALFAGIATESGVVRLDDALLELGSSVVTGSGRYAAKDKERRQVVLALDSDRLDLHRIVRSVPAARDLLALLSRPDAKNDFLAAAVQGYDFELKARIGQLLLGDESLRNIAIDARAEKGGLHVRSLRLLTAEQVAFTLEGRLGGFDQRPRGILNFAIETERADAIASLLASLGADRQSLLDGQIAGLAPLRLAGTLALPQTGDGAELNVDGALAGTRLVLAAHLDGSRLDPWTEPIDASLSLSNPDAAGLIALLWPALPADALSRQEQGRVLIKATGTLSTGVSVSAEMFSKSLEAGYSGTLSIGKDEVALEGDFALKAADAARAMRLFGLKPSAATSGKRLLAVATLSGKTSLLKLKSATAQLGDRSFDFGGTLARAKEGSRVDLLVKSREVSLPALLALLVPPPSERTALAPPAPAASDWGDEAIDFSTLGPLTGKVRIAAERLHLGQGLVLEAATADIDISDKGLSLKTSDGKALGGAFRASLAIDKGQAGVTLKLEAALRNGTLESALPADNGQPAATGVFNAELAVSGKGLSPRGIIATLAGKGRLDVGPALIRKLSPAAVQQTAKAVLESEFKPGEARFDPKTVRPILASALAKSVLKTPARSIALSVGDGSLRLDPQSIEHEEGLIRMTAIVDLIALRLDSEWMLEPKPLKPSQQSPKTHTLPPVSVVFSGPLAEIASLEPRIAADRLEQELTIRRAERDVEMLEKLKLREERQLETEPVPQRLQPTSIPVQPQPPPAEPKQTTTAPPATIAVPAPVPVVPADPATLIQPPPSEPPATTVAPRPRPRPPKQTEPDWQKQIFPKY